MRIGIDARMYGSRQTGIGNYIKNLIAELVQFPVGITWVLFLREPFFSTLEFPKNVVKVYAPEHWYSWHEQMTLPYRLMRAKLDLLHVPHFNVPLLYPGLMIVTVHDVIAFYYPGHRAGSSWVRRWGYRMVFRHAAKSAAKVIAVSEHTKKDIIQRTGCEDQKIAVTYLGVDHRRFFPVSSDNERRMLRARLGITKRAILYVGIWRIHKNVDKLIGAFEKLKNEYNIDAQLVLAGEQDQGNPMILKAIGQSAYKHDILMSGYVPDEQLPDFYRAADVLAHCTRYEGNALTCLEAAASGLPVVASKTTAIPEIMQDSCTYADPASADDIARALAEVLTNDLIRRELARRGRAHASHFVWRDTAKKTFDLYEQTTQKVS